jgi:ABC-type branched-subunit amino acid transport system ATPase component
MLVVPRHQPGEALWSAILRPSRGRRAEQKDLSRALELLNFFGLFELRDAYASELSGGQKRLLELARATMADPVLLLLDEPLTGINPVLVERISEQLREMCSWGVTLLLVEHNLQLVEALCDSVTVMIQGRAVTSGSMAEVREHEHVIEAYLGEQVEFSDR